MRGGVGEKKERIFFLGRSIQYPVGQAEGLSLGNYCYFLLLAD